MAGADVDASVRGAMAQSQAIYGEDGFRLVLDEHGRAIGSCGLPEDWRELGASKGDPHESGPA